MFLWNQRGSDKIQQELIVLWILILYDKHLNVSYDHCGKCMKPFFIAVYLNPQAFFIVALKNCNINVTIL